MRAAQCLPGRPLGVWRRAMCTTLGAQEPGGMDAYSRRNPSQRSCLERQAIAWSFPWSRYPPAALTRDERHRQPCGLGYQEGLQGGPAVLGSSIARHRQAHCEETSAGAAASALLPRAAAGVARWSNPAQSCPHLPTPTSNVPDYLPRCLRVVCRPQLPPRAGPRCCQRTQQQPARGPTPAVPLLLGYQEGAPHEGAAGQGW